MNIMPREMVEPEANLTYGVVVKYILDDRNKRMGTNRKSCWKPALDFCIFAS